MHQGEGEEWEVEEEEVEEEEEEEEEVEEEEEEEEEEDGPARPQGNNKFWRISSPLLHLTEESVSVPLFRAGCPHTPALLITAVQGGDEAEANRHTANCCATYV